MFVVGGKVGLIDYGQSKQLPDDARLAFAKLVIALASEGERLLLASDQTRSVRDRGVWDRLLNPDVLNPDVCCLQMNLLTLYEIAHAMPIS